LVSAFRKLGAGRIVEIRENACPCRAPGCPYVRVEFLGGARDGQKRWMCGSQLKPQARDA
jgi:hypothetical protein